MEANTKKGLIIGGSIAAVLLIAGGITIGIVAGGSNNSLVPTGPSNTKGIGAFANLESFDNDGFNNGVKTAGQTYLAEYEGNSEYFSNAEKEKLELKTSQYSDDGREYVDMLIDYFSTNDIIISAGFQVGGAITGQSGDAGFDGVFTDKNGNNTEYANSFQKAFVLLDDESLATQYTNTASVSFAAEGAGYLSAQIAWAYTQYDAATNHDAEADYTPNIVMWGGLNFPTVYDYMSGFAQGITDLNTEYAGAKLTGGDGAGTVLQDVVLWSGGTTASETIAANNTYDASKVDATDYDGSTWYTGGFDAVADGSTNGALAQTKTNNALSEGASVVFPIAGGNTSVAETEIDKAGEGTTTKLLGVDADATMSSSNDDLYIASAQKNLTDGGAIALWSMDDFDNDGYRNYEEDEIAENDNVGQTLSTNGILDEWQVEKTTSGADFVGAGLRGTLSNGGVGVIYGSQQVGGQENLNDTLAFFGKTEEDLDTYLETLSEKVVTNNDGNFVNMGISK